MGRFEPYAPGGGREPAPVRIRAATPADADAIAGLDGERNEVDPASIVDRIRAHLASRRDRHHVLVAELDGEVVAFARLGWVEHAALGPGWLLVGVIVRPDLRRRGIGRALVQARLELAAELGAAEVLYVTNARNQTSIALHRRFGFEEVARGADLPGGPFEGGVGIAFRVRVTSDPPRRP